MFNFKPNVLNQNQHKEIIIIALLNDDVPKLRLSTCTSHKRYIVLVEIIKKTHYDLSSIYFASDMILWI